MVRLYQFHALCRGVTVHFGHRLHHRHGGAAKPACTKLCGPIRPFLGGNFPIFRIVRCLRLFMVRAHHAVSGAEHRAVRLAEYPAIPARHEIVPPECDGEIIGAHEAYGGIAT